MSKIPFCEARGTLNSINDVLAGEQASMWLDAFKRVLRKENPWSAIGRTLKIIKIGVMKTHESYLKAFKDTGVQISGYAKSIFNKVPLTQVETEYEAVEVSVAELGFTDWTRYDVICQRAAERCLDKCPAEAALALRLAHLEQTKGEVLTVAMEPLAGPGADLNVFCVRHGDDGLWLHTDYGSPDYEFRPGRRLVFVRRK